MKQINFVESQNSVSTIFRVQLLFNVLQHVDLTEKKPLLYFWLTLIINYAIAYHILLLLIGTVYVYIVHHLQKHNTHVVCY